jgi:hypothetical protein
VAAVHHARTVGISDHFECLLDGVFDAYADEVRQAGLKVGVEVNGHSWVAEASGCDVDYFVYHCHDRDADYHALDRLLATATPVIVAHPHMLDTDLNRLPAESLIEINNRYVWRTDWKRYYGPFTHRFRFVLGSDAHQPNWLGQSVARHVAAELGVAEHLVF